MEKHRPKIHIIANCANRKRIPPIAQLCSISHETVEKRAKLWWEKLNNLSINNSHNGSLFQQKKGKLKAVDLYIGSYWAVIRNLPKKAQFRGFESDLRIISAGYGLISADDEIHSYSATFSQGDENSVTNGESDYSKRIQNLRNWWQLISNYLLTENSDSRKLSHLFQNYSNDYFLIVASADYLSAIEEDLLEGIKFLSSPENLVIITSKSFLNQNLEKHLISTDSRLQCNGNCEDNCETHLVKRGIRGSISAFLAEKIIERAEDEGFQAQKLKQFVENHIETSPMLISFNRITLDDEKIQEFITQELNTLSSASCTSLLRALRQSGMACEQKRFKNLYLKTKEGLL